MIKTIYKNKWVCILTVILLIASIFVYRTMSRNVLKISSIKNKIEPCGRQFDKEISKEQREVINSNLDDFAFVIYSFSAANESDNINISNISVNPVFSDEMREHVYFYSSSDLLNDEAGCLSQHKEKTYRRRILIRRNGLSDEELSNIAGKNSIDVTYDTSRVIPIISYWHSSMKFKAEDN